MSLHLGTAYQLTHTLMAIVFTLQFIEFFNLRKLFISKQPFYTKLLPQQISPHFLWVYRSIEFLTKYPHVLALLSFRQTLVILSFWYPSIKIYLFIVISTWLLLARFGGNFNGGSDSMGVILLSGLLLGELASGSSWYFVGLIYIAIHSAISYFKAGLSKIEYPEWRNGDILAWLVKSSPYSNPLGPFLFIIKKPFNRWSSYLILSFELSFPLALLNPKICLIFMFIGFLFHLSIFIIFGLNRFFWTWLATYPSLFYTSQLISQ